MKEEDYLKENSIRDIIPNEVQKIYDVLLTCDLDIYKTEYAKLLRYDGMNEKYTEYFLEHYLDRAVEVVKYLAKKVTNEVVK